ncbi:MAG: hypothetical protein WD042_13950 [Phycisphaeraceae bacterium]
MSQLPLEDITAEGYGGPGVTQFNVFLDNRVGKLRDLLEAFDGQALMVVALSVIDSADHAVVRVITSKADLGRHLLQRHHLPFSETTVLVVEMAKGQTLSKLCKAMLAAEINIHYAYPLMIRPHGYPTIALHTDEPEVACDVLRRKMFILLGEDDMRDSSDNLDR